MGAKFLIIAGRFNEMISNQLLVGARDVLAEAGFGDQAVDIVWVPGAYEMPCIAGVAARSKKYAAIITLGAVIRGETPHFDFVAGEAASGLMKVSVETGVPVVFGVLTTNTTEQALARSGLKGGNNGRSAASTALSMIKTIEKLTRS